MEYHAAGSHGIQGVGCATDEHSVSGSDALTGPDTPGMVPEIADAGNYQEPRSYWRPGRQTEPWLKVRADWAWGSPITQAAPAARNILIALFSFNSFLVSSFPEL